jgi:hypothetical protein
LPFIPLDVKDARPIAGDFDKFVPAVNFKARTQASQPR